MRPQVLKLLFILNCCSWLTLSFACWHYSAGFPQQLVSTVVVLGVLAVLANLVYWVAQFWMFKKLWQPQHQFLQVFIALSTLVQVLLILFLVR